MRAYARVIGVALVLCGALPAAVVAQEPLVVAEEAVVAGVPNRIERLVSPLSASRARTSTVAAWRAAGALHIVERSVGPWLVASRFDSEQIETVQWRDRAVVVDGSRIVGAEGMRSIVPVAALATAGATEEANAQRRLAWQVAGFEVRSHFTSHDGGWTADVVLGHSPLDPQAVLAAMSERFVALGFTPTAVLAPPLVAADRGARVMRHAEGAEVAITAMTTVSTRRDGPGSHSVPAGSDVVVLMRRPR